MATITTSTQIRTLAVNPTTQAALTTPTNLTTWNSSTTLTTPQTALFDDCEEDYYVEHGDGDDSCDGYDVHAGYTETTKV